MLSIGRLNGPRWSAEYYLAQQAGCPADYYTGSGERRGIWIGGGAAALGLIGEVEDDAFRAVLRGHSPDGEEQWVAPLLRVDPRGTVSGVELVRLLVASGLDEDVLDERLLERWHRARRGAVRALQGTGQPSPRVPANVASALCAVVGIDPRHQFPNFADALAHADDRVDKRLPGLDLTFSAPKSVSIVYALSDLVIADQVRAGHEAAVLAAVRYLESVAGHALRGHQGDGHEAHRVETEGFIAAAFEHRSNRCGDMQLHTHVVVANMLRDHNGRVSALDSRELYRQARTAGYLYQAVLRHELTTRIGVEWQSVRRGSAEVRGVPSHVRRAFSKRRQQIEAALQGSGRVDRAAAQRATLLTRPAKAVPQETAALRQRWSAEANALGFTDRDVAQLLSRAKAVPLDVERRHAIGSELAGTGGLTLENSTFDRRDVIQATCERVRQGATAAEIAQASSELLRRPDVVPVAARGHRYSTVDLLSIEQQTLTAVKAGWSVGGSSVKPDHVDTLSDIHGLNAGQRDAVRRLLSTDDALSVLVGPAGCGKTSALRVAHRGWATSGRRVSGASVAASAARQLESETGIASCSLARLLADAESIDEQSGRRKGLPSGGVVVLDEAGMTGTRDLARLVALASESQTRLVLVGDPFQLPAVEAGGMLAALANSPDAISLTDNVRQAEPWERDALADMRAGELARSVSALAAHGRLHVDEDPATVREAMLDSWSEMRPSHRQVVMIAPRRSQCFALNQLARERMRESGELGPIELRVEDDDLGPRSFAVGDVVVVTKNSYAEGLLNGTRGTVVGMDVAEGLSIEDADGLVHRVPASHVADRLDHAYAVTCHRAQGMTADVGLLMVAGPMAQEAAYVGMSRGRVENHLFAVADDLEALREDTVSRETDDLPADRDDDTRLERGEELDPSAVAGKLQRSGAKSLASREEGVDLDDLRRRLELVRTKSRASRRSDGSSREGPHLELVRAEPELGRTL